MKRMLATLLCLALLLSAVPFASVPQVKAATEVPEGYDPISERKLNSNATDVYSATTDFAGGNGTEEDPYLISTKEHLDNVRFYMSSHFKMIDDIVFDASDFSESGSYYNNGSGWEPIGFAPDSFSGVFDGDSHCISNLQINRDVSYIGLFGTISSQGVVKNLRFSDAVVVGDSYVGGIAGRLLDATVSNCSVSANVTGNSYVGGIAGYISNATVSNCSVSANVTGSNDVGGVVGKIYAESVVEFCSAHGSVQGKKYVGGVCGYIDPFVESSKKLYATTRSCYNAATVIAEDIAGGIAGYVYATYDYETDYHQGSYGGASYFYVVWYAPKEVLIENCYNTGDITATNGTAGGIVASAICASGPYSSSSKNTHKSTLLNSYNIGEIKATSTNYSIAQSGSSLSSTACYYLEGCTATNSGVGTKLTHNQLRAQSTFSQWDFENVWTLSGNPDYLYPELQSVPMEYTKSLIGISVVAKPAKSSYIEGKETLDLTGAKLMLKYNNNTTENIDITADMVSGFDNTMVGDQTLKVSYGGFETSFDVTILAKTLSAIAVTTLPDKLTYLAGRDLLDVTGGKITLYYDNDTQEVLDLTIDMVSGFDNTEIGLQTLTVTFSGKTASYEIEIVPKQLVYIELTVLPSKRTYKEGKDLLDVTGGRISLYYNDDTSEEIDMTVDMVSGFSNALVGKQTLLVSYEGKTVTYEVEVVEKQLIAITIASLPTKLTYTDRNEELDVAGGKITLFYDNDTEEDIDMTVEMITGFDNAMLGTQVLTVSYGGKTASFTIEIIHVHSYVEDVIAPTCTETGYTTHTCSVCGDSYTDTVIDALGHSWDDGTVIIAATCTANGKMKYACTACGEVKEEVITATGHNYVDTVTRPTCTATGYTTHTCANCGDSYKDTYVGATGHAWNDGIDVIKPTCTEVGEKVFTCGNCGETRSKEIAALGHSYEAVVTAPTCIEGGYTAYTCSACGDSYVADEVDALGHSYEAVVTAPTCTEGGYTTYTCSACGESYVADKVAATGHSFEDGNCSVCGEEDPDYLPENPFADVKDSDYFFTPVLWAVQKGITNGISATEFGPNAPCTRGQIVTFLWRACGSPEPTKTDNPFTDVKATDYYYKAVLWAVESGITNGMSATTFEPNATCTRGQVATFLWRAQGKPVPAGSSNPFSDVNRSDYYYEAVLWAVENGVTQGTGAGKFSPNDSCTRGQIVTFLYRALA